MAPSTQQLVTELEELDAELDQMTASQANGLDFFRSRVNQLINDIVGPKDALAIRFNGLQWDSGGSSVRRRLDHFGEQPGFVTQGDSVNFDRSKQATREVLQTLKWKLGRQGPVAAVTNSDSHRPTPSEANIIAGLEAQAPNASACYQQAIKDLADQDRLSYRGVANELRAAVWEVLEALAPDEDVTAASGFILEKGRTTPTHKQKARHILRSRLGDTARETPEASLDIIEERVGALTRSIYGRTSTSSHVEAERGEVQQIKMYVDSVLAELLGIFKQ